MILFALHSSPMQAFGVDDGLSGTRIRSRFPAWVTSTEHYWVTLAKRQSGVADVMKEAGVTVGGFYKHFGSRDELVVEALETAFKDLDVWEEHTADMAQLLQNYLTEAHRDAPGTGCAMGALLGDMTRGSKSARVLYTTRVRRTLAFSSALLPSNQGADKRGRALLILSALLGAINLSRAVSDPNLSREIAMGFARSSLVW